ncbi:hypothetical protein AWC38_SpisGene5601 [Stylophora pistillata]|uniref:YqaJ viral recombinase domain-containing protein n=1 Tax=Stylophora pistillata TaxID=50429 RepID=A0A2B4SM94_STYPI|nr:hypothetical protein AWC38_SpisGene5601 [Stylophora pistillata]
MSRRLVQSLEEYVSRRLDHDIVDPDPAMIYTKGNLYRMGVNSHRTADDSSVIASSSTPSPGTQWKQKIPSECWGSSLEKAPLFTKAEMDRHIGKSGKHIVEGEHKSCGITSLLYEARKVYRKSKFNDFLEAVQKIDPILGLVQTCELNTNDPVDTRFGESRTGLFGSYQLAFQEFNFKVTCNLAPSQQASRASNSQRSYPSLPLDDLNDDFVLDLPDDLDILQNKLLDELKVTMHDANKIEENTRDQHNCNAWTEERRSASTDHGIKYEAVALRDYKKHMYGIGHPVKVERSGFFVSPKLFFLGCTPDGKVVDISCPEDQYGLMEVKFPS